MNMSICVWYVLKFFIFSIFEWEIIPPSSMRLIILKTSILTSWVVVLFGCRLCIIWSSVERWLTVVTSHNMLVVSGKNLWGIQYSSLHGYACRDMKEKRVSNIYMYALCLHVLTSLYIHQSSSIHYCIWAYVLLFICILQLSCVIVPFNHNVVLKFPLLHLSCKCAFSKFPLQLQNKFA